MGAASIIPDPRIAVSESAIPTGWLAVAVALASFVDPAARLLRPCARHARPAPRWSWKPTACAASPTPRSKACWSATAQRSSPPTTASPSWPASHEQTWSARIAVGVPARRGDAHASCSSSPATADRDRAAPRRRRADPGRARSCGRSISPASRIRRSPCATCARARRPKQHIRFLAHHDALTGLPNRAQLQRASSTSEIAPARAGTAGSLPCSASTSTASRRSTTCSAMPPATRCCSASPRCVDGVLDDESDAGAARRRRVRRHRCPA